MFKVRYERLWQWMLGASLVPIGVFVIAPRHSVWQVGAFFVPLVAATALLAARTFMTARSSRQELVLLVGVQVGYLVTTMLWYLGPLVLGRALPFPSFVDAMYFVVYAGYACFLLMVMHRRAGDREVWRQRRRGALIDAAVLTTSMSALLWVTVIEPVRDAGASPLATTVAMLFPACTLLLFGLAAGLALGRDLGRSTAGVLLLCWIGGEIVADAIYGAQGAAGTFEYGQPFLVLYMTSYGMLAALATHPATVRLLAGHEVASQPPASRHLVQEVSLILLLGAALVTVLVAIVDRQASWFLTGCSVLTVTLVVYRTFLMARDLQYERQLTHRLDNAVAQLRTQGQQLEAQARELEHLAFHDTITGLGNRALLWKRVAEQSGSHAGESALLLLDLDGFKEVNDTLGHGVGDALLLHVGSRLGDVVRSNDIAVRLGGDEFAVLLPETGMIAATATAERVREELRKPFHIGGSTIRVRSSIGIATGSGDHLDELLRNADLAMYEAKAAGRDQAQVFQPRMYEDAALQRHIENELRVALDDEQLTVYYQPIVDAVSGAIRSVEALVRWDHPQRGVLPPSEFLPVAQRNGLIAELGAFVLRSACEQVAQWRERWPDLQVAVNVSQEELLQPSFVETVQAVLAQFGLPASALTLEITETVLASDDAIASIVEPLVEFGIGVAIDDFGTGHSSLSRLRHLAVTTLKIDKSFVAEVSDADPKSAPLLASIVALAHSVGAAVVAEGVETSEQAAFLTAQGCEELQGYFFSRPVAAGQIIPVLLATGVDFPRQEANPARSAGIVAGILDTHAQAEHILPELLRELAALSGFECTFLTEVREDTEEQVTRFSHCTEPGLLQIAPGLTVQWRDTLCRRMLEDDVMWADDVGRRYGDVAAATALALETFVSVPVRDRTGHLCGTLCAASTRTREADRRLLELMQLFAEALGDRMSNGLVEESPASSSGLDRAS